MFIAAAADADKEIEVVTLNVVARSQYPAWQISMAAASIELSYELAGDWDAFAVECAVRRGL